jgi:hypothetical protein
MSNFFDQLGTRNEIAMCSLAPDFQTPALAGLGKHFSVKLRANGRSTIPLFTQRPIICREREQLL